MTTPRDDIAGLSESEPTKEQVAACERAMDGLDAQADIWAEEIALVNIVKNLGEVSRGLNDRMPTDVREGFINRQEAQIDALIRQAYSEGFYRGGESRKEYDAAQNATQLDSLLKERDALLARVKELENRAEVADYKLGQAVNTVHPMLTSRALRAEQERDTLARVMEDTANELGCEPNNETILEAIVSLQQERDEAYERAASLADCYADQCDATAIMSEVEEQVAALRSKEQAANRIAADIRRLGRS